MSEHEPGIIAIAVGVVATALGGLMALIRLVNKPILVRLDGLKDDLIERKETDKVMAADIAKLKSDVGFLSTSVGVLDQKVTDHVEWEEGVKYGGKT